VNLSYCAYTEVSYPPSPMPWRVAVAEFILCFWLFISNIGPTRGMQPDGRQVCATLKDGCASQNLFPLTYSEVPCGCSFFSTTPGEMALDKTSRLVPLVCLVFQFKIHIYLHFCSFFWPLAGSVPSLCLCCVCFPSIDHFHSDGLQSRHFQLHNKQHRDFC
jgi:hypothetical protein